MLPLHRSLLVSVLVFAGAAGCVATRDKARSPSRDSAPPGDRGLPAGLVAAADAVVDAGTGLPTRVVHPALRIRLVLVPVGEFEMREDPLPAEADAARPVSQRRIVRRPFYLGETEVTVGQFRTFVAETGYRTDAERGVSDSNYTVGSFTELPVGKGVHRSWQADVSWRNPLSLLRSEQGEGRLADDRPVVQVSWNDAKEFAAHYGFALPTQAQWEYACRAGTRTRFFWGDDPAGGAGRANVADAAFARQMFLSDGVFPFDDGVMALAPAGAYEANAFGLRDMIGSVEEWCEDDNVSTVPIDMPVEEASKHTADDGRHHPVVRGGSWIGGPGSCGCGIRHGIIAEGRRDWIGFRVAVPLPGVGNRPNGPS